MNRRCFCQPAIFVLLTIFICSVTSCRKAPRLDGPIRIGILKHESALPFYVAKELGLFDKHGIQVALSELPPGDHMPALIADRVDIITPTSFPLLFGVMNQSPDYLYAVFPGAEVADGPPVYGFVVRNDFSGTQLGDLLGKVVMAINPYTQVNIQTIMSSAGYTKDQWPEVRVAARDVALSAVSDGTASSAIMDQPALATALSTGKFRLLESNPRAKHIGSPYWSGSGAVKRTVWATRQEDMKKLMAAYDESVIWTRANTDEAHRILARALGLDPIIANQCGGYFFPTQDEVIPATGIQATIEALVKAGLLKSTISMDRFFPPGLYGQR